MIVEERDVDVDRLSSSLSDVCAQEPFWSTHHTMIKSQTTTKMRLFLFAKKNRRDRPETWVMVDDLVLDEQRAGVKV